MTFEARDSAAKVVPARFKLSTTTRANAPRINSARRTTGMTPFCRCVYSILWQIRKSVRLNNNNNNNAFSLFSIEHSPLLPIAFSPRVLCWCSIQIEPLIVCRCCVVATTVRVQNLFSFAFVRFILKSNSGGHVIDTCRGIADGPLGQSIGCVQNITRRAVAKCSNGCIGSFFENALVSRDHSNMPIICDQFLFCLAILPQFATTIAERTTCVAQWLRTEFDRMPSFVNRSAVFDVADPSNPHTLSIVHCKGENSAPSGEYIGPYAFARIARESSRCIVRWNWSVFAASQIIDRRGQWALLKEG